MLLLVYLPFCLNCGIIFYLRSLDYLILGSYYPSNVNSAAYGLHIIEQALSQIRYWLLQQALCHNWTSMSYCQDTIVEQSVYGWVGVYGSPLAAAKCLYQKG